MWLRIWFCRQGTPHKSEDKPAVQMSAPLGVLFLWCPASPAPKQHGANGWRPGPSPACTEDSLLFPAVLATSSLCPSLLSAAPGLSSTAPEVWWQHGPGHLLTSSLFLVSPVGQRVEGSQHSHAISGGRAALMTSMNTGSYLLP